MSTPNTLLVSSMNAIFPGNIGVIPVQAVISQYEKSDETNSDLILAKTGAAVHGIFDTGASRSAISERVAERLALRKVNAITVHTAAGTVQQDCHVVNIVVMPNEIVFPAHQVTSAKLHSCDILIGMDIIGLGDFIISRRHGFLVVEFRLFTPC